MIPAEIENARLKLALAIPTGASITAANDEIEMLLGVQIKRLMTYKNSQKKWCTYKVFCSLVLFF